MPSAWDDALPEILETVLFDQNGLVPAIAQQDGTGEVLMMAWMNREAIKKTLATGQVHYWSRSRKQLWRKGESSGQTQTLIDFRLDCDGDTVLVTVEQKGVACHTGRQSCFFRAVRGGKLENVEDVLVDPKNLYKS
ncbi:MAG: phosphoribosyl-AMP cyclohydrolase [Rhodospirillaceae bacterium]|nr:MAG: phosphoribosyl-AMP cyclohydrolase [Rhodospirillaceae bacterium]